MFGLGNTADNALNGAQGLAQGAFSSLTDAFSNLPDPMAYLERVMQEQMANFREELQAVPAEQRYDALKERLEGFNVDQNLLDKLDQAGPELQQALTHAISNNEHFLGYLMNNASADAQGSVIGDIANQMFVTTTDGNTVVDPTKAGYVQDILTNIGNNPEVDFAQNLDEIAAATQAHADTLSLTGEAGAKAQHAAHERMVDALRGAGANLPFLAKFEIGDLFQFIDDVFSGRGIEQAVANLADNLGLEGEQLGQFQSVFEPIAHTMNFIAEPYVGVYQDHKRGINDGITSIQNTVSSLSGGARVEAYSFQVDAAATTGSIDLNEFQEKFSNAVSGASLDDLDTVLNALEKADPALGDEVAAIKSDIALKAQFEKFSGLSGEAAGELATDLYENFTQGQTVRQSVMDMKL